MVKALLDHGAKVNVSAPYGRTALIEAIINKRERSVRILIRHGADVNYQTRFGMTPLKLAKALGRSTIIQMLKPAGAKR
jgi:ankyrin repeat protein